MSVGIWVSKYPNIIFLLTAAQDNLTERKKKGANLLLHMNFQNAISSSLTHPHLDISHLPIKSIPTTHLPPYRAKHQNAKKRIALHNHKRLPPHALPPHLQSRASQPPQTQPKRPPLTHPKPGPTRFSLSPIDAPRTNSPNRKLCMNHQVPRPLSPGTHA